MISKQNPKIEDPHVVSVLSDLALRIGKAMGDRTQLTTPISGLTLYRNTVPTAPNPIRTKNI